MALEKVAEATLESGRSPSHIIMWSDGAPNQFKYTYPIWFLSKFKNSKFKNKYGFEKVWWNFYASCHGKGMQDAAGAWVKSRVAKAILLGGEIKSVREFFDYCMLYLTCQSDLKVEQVANTSFTSSRRFYLLEAEELARFRANAEQVTTWSGARKCHFFWAGMEKDEVGRKWVGYACAFCLEENFDKCACRHLFIVDGVDYNAPTVARLEAKAPTARTRAEEIAASLKVYMILYDC